MPHLDQCYTTKKVASRAEASICQLGRWYFHRKIDKYWAEAAICQVAKQVAGFYNVTCHISWNFGLPQIGLRLSSANISLMILFVNKRCMKFQRSRVAQWNSELLQSWRTLVRDPSIATRRFLRSMYSNYTLKTLWGTMMKFCLLLKTHFIYSYFFLFLTFHVKQ